MERHWFSEHCRLKIALFLYTSVGRCGMNRKPAYTWSGSLDAALRHLFLECQAMDNVGGARAERESLKSIVRSLGATSGSRVPDGCLTQPLMDGRSWARWETVSDRQQSWLPH